MNRDRMLKLLKELSLKFGPSGCERDVAEAVLAGAEGLYDECIRDCFGNVILKIASEDVQKPPLMISAHMDEVGFMISDIDDYGYLHFQTVGGISPSVMPGRRVRVESFGGNYLNGVISSKPIHLQSPEERKKPYETSKLVIDIGAKSRAEAEKYTQEGNFAVFESEYTVFGEEGEWIKSKALDDRFGCVVALETMMNIKKCGIKSERDIYFAFTTREETGLSGALPAANRIKPGYAIVLETTAIGDIYGTPEQLKVAKAGEGGCILIADRSTIYDKELFSLAMDTAKKNGIPCQVKKYVSGGNDSAHIHKSSRGVKTLALSAPTRYLHSSSCVVNVRDLFSVYELLNKIIPLI